jgi:hypothetical protein
MPVVLPFVTIVVELTAAEVGSMFSFEAMMIVFVVDPVPVVAMPFGISIVGIARVASFKVDTYMHLGAGRLNGHGAGDDHSDN